MPSRISTSQIYSNAQTHVAQAREREVTSSEKASSMKEITRPSQNPAGFVQAATMKDDLSIRDTIAKNASLATHVLNTSESVLSQMQEYVQKAHELAVASAGSDDTGAAHRKHALTEMKSIFDGAIQVLNTRYGNRTLFAGLKSQGPAFDAQGKYVGDSNPFELEIARGQVVPISVSAEKAIEGKGMQDGVNILSTFQGLMQGLANDDMFLVREALDPLMKANDQISLSRSELAARMSQVDQAVATHASTSIDSREAISKIEDADAIKVFSELARDQTVLQAAMSTSQKILSADPSDILFK